MRPTALQMYAFTVYLARIFRLDNEIRANCKRKDALDLGKSIIELCCIHQWVQGLQSLSSASPKLIPLNHMTFVTFVSPIIARFVGFMKP